MNIHTMECEPTNIHLGKKDPPVGDDELIEERNNNFFPNFVADKIFAKCVDDQPQLSRKFILFYIEKTSQLSLTI